MYRDGTLHNDVGAKNETNLHFNRIGPRMNLCVITTFFFSVISNVSQQTISHILSLFLISNI